MLRTMHGSTFFKGVLKEAIAKSNLLVHARSLVMSQRIAPFHEF